MQTIVHETEHTNSAMEYGAREPADRHAEAGELSMSALDEANGGLMHLAVTAGLFFLIGRGAASLYRDGL